MRNGSRLSQAGRFHKQLWSVMHSFITLNVRGINSLRKRRAIFRQLHNKNASVIFLQETYSSNNQKSYGAVNGVVKFISATVASTAKVLPFYLTQKFR